MEVVSPVEQMLKVRAYILQNYYYLKIYEELSLWMLLLTLTGSTISTAI